MDVYTMEYYSVFKKKEILLFLTTWMKLKYVMVSKISQKEKRQILHNITYMWNLKKKKKKERKKSNSWKQSVQWWLPGAWERRKQGEID